MADWNANRYHEISLPQQAWPEFVATVCIRPYHPRVPIAWGASFVGALTEQAALDDPPITLEYLRLNTSARRPGPVR